MPDKGVVALNIPASNRVEGASALMIKTANMRIKMISLLLHYPDESLLGLLPEFREALKEIEDVTTRDKYEHILPYFEQTPLIQLQERYTETFDLKPLYCLNMTYHRWGDSEKRGPALAHLEEIYRQAGCERINNELPDYLPLMLEFIAVQPDDGSLEIITLYGSTVEMLTERLRKARHPYVALFEQLVDLLGSTKTAVDSRGQQSADR